MIKMIVTDLDGTLLNSEKKVTEKTKKYLNTLKEKGIIIVIATGRIYQEALDVTDGASFANYIITDNGACIYDMTFTKTLSNCTIEKNDIKKILKLYDENFEYVVFCTKNKGYKLSNGGITEMFLNEINDLEINHIALSMKTNIDVKDTYKKLKRNLKKLNIAYMQDSFSNKITLKILPENCSKKNAVNELRKILKLKKSNLLIFGDGLNDVEMLKSCGIGVALKNALPEVKKAAKDITIYDNNNDGIRKYLTEKGI